MKVLHICSYFSTSPIFKQLFDRQIDHDIDIDVYVPIAHEYPSDRIAASGNYTTMARTHHQNDRLFFHYKHHKILHHLKKQFNFSEYDLIHAHSLFSNGWLAYRLHKMYGIPYMVAVRSADIETFFKKAKWLWPIGMNILRHAEKVIFISQNSYNETFQKYTPPRMQKTLKAKTEVIANGIDNFWHEHRVDQPHREPHRPLRLIATGKLIKAKRLETLAQNVEQLNQTIPAKLEIVGPNWEDSIEENLKSYPHTTYLGAKNKEELVDLYRQADIFTLLSYPETFGLVYVEAMSQGLPVVYTQNEGFDSFFPDYTVGIGIPRNDTAAFISGIQHILTDYSHISETAIVKSQLFQWDDIVKKYLAIYDTIVN